MDDSIKYTAIIAQALAHPLRLQILELLRDHGAYVMHLTAVLDRPQANVSHHLAILREAGLVRHEHEGMTVLYRVADPNIYDVIAGMQALDLAARERPSFAGPRRGRDSHCRYPRCRGEPT